MFSKKTPTGNVTGKNYGSIDYEPLANPMIVISKERRHDVFSCLS